MRAESPVGKSINPGGYGIRRGWPALRGLAIVAVLGAAIGGPVALSHVNSNTSVASAAIVAVSPSTGLGGPGNP